MKRLLIVLAVLSVCASEVQAVDESESLEGLWAARQDYRAQIEGPLLILRRDGVLVADVAGFSIPVRREGRSIVFTLPDGRGNFRGAESGRNILGHWIQPPTIRDTRPFATPVTLRGEGRERWAGEIVPLADHMTYFLPITRGAGGAYDGYLRNPDRNLGRFIFPVSRIELDGNAVRLLGTRSGAESATILASGVRDAEAGMLRLQFGGRTFDFAPETAPTSAFHARPLGERYRYAPPVQVNDDWPVSTLEAEGISTQAIERFVQMVIDAPNDTISSSQVHGILIARHGRLVLEEYFHGYDRGTAHDMRSASKSWTAVLIGAAMQAGVPIRRETPVYATMLADMPADLDPRKRAMTLEHLVTMTAGFACDGNSEDVMQQQTQEPDWYRYTLNLPMESAPGERIEYCSEEPHLAGGVLERIAGEPLPEMFDRLVARPLNMGRYHVQLTPTAAAYGGGGHYFRPRDFLKLAQLMVNEGRWGGRQIVDADWARQSVAPLRNLSATQQYGFLWNAHQYPYQGRTVHAFFAGGNGGQIFMGIPELDLVIGFTGGSYNDRALFTPQRVYVPELILPAVN